MPPAPSPTLVITSIKSFWKPPSPSRVFHLHKCIAFKGLLSENIGPSAFESNTKKNKGVSRQHTSCHAPVTIYLISSWETLEGAENFSSQLTFFGRIETFISEAFLGNRALWSNNIILLRDLGKPWAHQFAAGFSNDTSDDSTRNHWSSVCEINEKSL